MRLSSGYDFDGVSLQPSSMLELRSNRINKVIEILNVLSSSKEISTLLSELFGSDGLVLLPRVTVLINIFDKSCLDGKSVNSLLLVTADNAYVNRSLLCQLDGLNDITAEFVLHCEYRNQP